MPAPPASAPCAARALPGLPGSLDGTQARMPCAAGAAGARACAAACELLALHAGSPCGLGLPGNLAPGWLREAPCAAFSLPEGSPSAALGLPGAAGSLEAGRAAFAPCGRAARRAFHSRSCSSRESLGSGFILCWRVRWTGARCARAAQSSRADLPIRAAAAGCNWCGGCLQQLRKRNLSTPWRAAQALQKVSCVWLHLFLKKAPQAAALILRNASLCTHHQAPGHLPSGQPQVCQSRARSSIPVHIQVQPVHNACFVVEAWQNADTGLTTYACLQVMWTGSCSGSAYC